MALETILAAFPPVVGLTAVPIKRQLSYVLNYKWNLRQLRIQVEHLKAQGNGLQQSANEATGRGDAIKDDVQKWLNDAKDAIEEAEKLVGEEQATGRCFFELIPNFKKQWQLSKRAAEKASQVARIAKDCNFVVISYRQPPVQILAPSVIDNETLPSRVSNLDKVMVALKDPKFNVIGVSGMSGVGKSTLAKEVHRKAIEDKLLDVVVMVTVSQKLEIRKIQGKIADMLALELVEETEDGRACRVHQRPKNEKTILIILDDIWEQLKRGCRNSYWE